MQKFSYEENAAQVTQGVARLLLEKVALRVGNAP